MRLAFHRSHTAPKLVQYSPASMSVARVVIAGTWFVIAAITVLLCVSYYSMHNSGAISSLAVCVFAFVFITAIYMLSRLNHHIIAAHMLVLFYLFIASGIAWKWGVNTPIAPLFFGVVIVLAGILLTARLAFIKTVLSGLALFVIQTSENMNWHQPDISWTGDRSSYGDVAAYAMVFCFLALVAWLYTREMERALTKARSAEGALKKQRTMLLRQAKERTKELERLQVEELKHMYRFAELGQLGVAMLHDLANNLTALTLEIEGAKEGQYSRAMIRARRITQYLGGVVDNTRDRLNGRTIEKTFDIVRKMDDTIDFLQNKASQNDVVIDWQRPKGHWKYTGDPISFSQIVVIVANNAVDAYKGVSNAEQRTVSIVLQRDEEYITVRICDWGKGITKRQRKRLFEPHRSTKELGLGLGLYIVKQTIETLFMGTIGLDPRTDRTEFIIRLTRNDKK